MPNIRLVVGAIAVIGALLSGHTHASADEPGPSPTQQWIDDVVPAPALPPAATPAERDLSPELSALWNAVSASPTGDPIFDRWPEDLAGRAPGEIVEWRDVTATAAPLVVVPIRRALLLKFRSSDSYGKPSFGTATLIVPAAEWTGAGSRPVVVNALPINSLGRTCTPSYALAHGLHQKFSTGDLVPPTTAWAVQRGYAVLVPDHEGPRMAYGEPIVAGHAVLDAIRAVRQQLPVEFGESRFAVSGYSGGAIASFGAAMLLGEYAPELAQVVAGTSMGGLITDYRAIAEKFNGNVASGILMAAGLAIAREHPQMLAHLNNLAQWVAISPIKDTCGDSNGPLGVLGLPIDVGLDVADPLRSDFIESYFEHVDLTGRKAVAPMYIYHGSLDFGVPIEQGLALQRKQCELGVTAFHQPLFGEHIIGLFGGWPGSMTWIDARLRGEPAPNSCH
ncbi:lipase family protein [Nocardia sp. NPDC058658]|uniref:lipase family protein n=1 Tax=Nocardia sp. NPDC058658 TaxID=3346580 RepID=UPI00365B6688